MVDSKIFSILAAGLILLACGGSGGSRLFESSTDIGAPPLSGSYQYDAAKDEYRATGSGENMWNEKDAFFYVWRKAAGDLVLTADVELAGEGKNAHLLQLRPGGPDEDLADARRRFAANTVDPRR